MKNSPRSFFFFLALFLLMASGNFACRPQNASSSKVSADSESSPPSRIVSLVPSVTETLFALGLGDRIVGVSDYCRYPAEAQKLPKLGGLYTPMTERILELRPDLVILFREHAELKSRLERLGLKTLTVDHSSIEGILDSFEIIARRFEPEIQENARRLRTNLEERIAQIRRQTEGEKPVKVLISIDRTRGTGKITQIYAAGKNPYFNEILAIAGGVNPLADSLAAVPTVSREGILETRPDVILDFSTDGQYLETTQLTDELKRVYLADWESLGPSVPAVRSGQIYPILDDYATVPGPRFILLIEKIAAILHPKISQKSM